MLGNTAVDAIKFMRDTAILSGTDAGSRIYVAQAPQSSTYPLVVMSIVSRVPTPTQDSGSAVDTFRIQVDTYAKQSRDISDLDAFVTAHDVDNALRSTWSRSSSDPGDYDTGIDSIQEDNSFDDFLTDLDLYRVSTDYFVRVVGGGTAEITNGVITIRSNVIYRTKVTLTYADFATAALTNTIDLGFTLPAKGVIHMITGQATTAFTGGAISDYSLKVGITGDLDRYIFNQSVFTLDLDALMTMAAMESMTATTALKVTATSVGANLSAATAGSVSYWIYHSTLN